MLVRFMFLFILQLTTLWHSYANSVEDSRRPYKNLYGTEDFKSTPSENVIETIVGASEFMQNSYSWDRRATKDTTPKQNSVYDFIVVGAGTAGATIASRLSEIEDVKILLIEAGPEESTLMDIPLMLNSLQASDDINWKYQTEPSYKYCVGMRGHRCNWPRGKVMGGSSVLNFMIATRGHPEDYDEWARMGNEGWAYKDVLKYFKKFENMQIPELQNDTEHHNTKGPVPISYPSYHTPLAEAFLKSGQELGYPIIDYNSRRSIGFNYFQSTTKDGLRISSNRAFLHDKYRDNLHVTKNTIAHRVLFNELEKRANGVLIEKNGRFRNVYAKKEVILCASVIGSAQILMLSGIGPAEHLKSLGIDVIQDSPVGDNLMDHVSFVGLSFTVNQPVSLGGAGVLDIRKPYLRDYLHNQTGPLTILGGIEAVAFVDVDNPEERDGIPNIEIMQSAMPFFGSQELMDNLGFSDYIQDAFSGFSGKPGWGLSPFVMKPKSRGWIRLKTTDIHDKPEIVPNYFDDPYDVETFIKGIRLCWKISQSQAFKQFGSEYINKTVPGCEGFVFDSDDYWECQLRMTSANIYHYSGTCKMGPKNDTTAVVDPRLNVIGVNGLRVADISILPVMVAAHTNLPAYMIGEKAADMIKEDWGYHL